MPKNIIGASVRVRPGRSGDRAWQVRWREKGRQFSRTFKSAALAEQFERKVGIIKDIQSVMASSLLDPGRISDLIPTYVDLVRAKNKVDSSHADQVDYILSRDSKRMGVTWTTEIDTNAFDRLVSCYGKHRATLKKAISTFKTFLRWVRRSRLAIDEWVFEYKSPKHISEESIAWNDNQVRRLLAECDKPNLALSLPSGDGTGRGSDAIMKRMAATRDFYTRQALRRPLRFMLRYAARPMEVSRVVIGNWDSATRTMYFPGKITKNGYPRDFVVDEEIAQHLDEAAGDRPPKEPLFLSYKGHRFLSHHLTDLISELIERARLPGTPYSTRHTATTRLIHLAKGDLPLVQSITGHRTLSELQRYLHATNDRRMVVADAYNDANEAKPTPLPSLRFVE